MTKEEEILKAAEDEFFKNGYDASSTAIIASRAGVTHAMVNYYFRSKEKLFVRILDDHVYGLLQSLKPLMQADGNVATVAVNAACVIFDRMNEDRRFPYLISDISRTHPDFLLRYKDNFVTVCRESLEKHAQRLEKAIAEGLVRECTMHDIYHSVLTLSTAPFFSLPILENVAGLSPERIDAWILSRKEEMIKTLKARYSRL